jgi:hypothetical protein
MIESAYKTSNEAGMSVEELSLQYKKQKYIAVQKGFDAKTI